jgi:hypothetical protein
LFCLQFPATAVNDAASASVILRNSSSSTSQLFEFGVPAGSWLQVRCNSSGGHAMQCVDFRVSTGFI